MRHSKAMGCFYVESPAMRMLLGKLECEDYLTLVAASSIIRPGVASSGMMKKYIERFRAAKKGITYEVLHPKGGLRKDVWCNGVHKLTRAHYLPGLL